MSDPLEPVVFDQRSSRERGRAHGELWREEIASLVQIRRELVLSLGRCETMHEVDALAAEHLPVLAEHAPELSDELLGIAEGAACTPADLVVLNGFEDLCSLAPTQSTDRGFSDDDPGGSTSIYFGTLQGPVMGQTWDLHASAEPFVRMIRIQPADCDEESLCFTLTGCLGMSGVGSSGVAVAINHLRARDGAVGLLWPAVVRRLLAQSSATAVRALLPTLPLCGGRHFMIADGRDYYGVETSSTEQMLTQTGPKAAHLHSNHYFDPKLRQSESVPRRSTTFARLNMATTLFAQHRPASSSALWDLLGSHDGHPRGICSHAGEGSGDPHAPRTCGRMVVELRTAELSVGRGCSRADAGVRLAVERFSPA